jgi:hypothetical protein
MSLFLILMRQQCMCRNTVRLIGDFIRDKHDLFVTCVVGICRRSRDTLFLWWRCQRPRDDASAAEYVHNDLEAPHHPCAIRAWAVVRDSQIWISTEGAGTYSFDTQTGTWSNAGDWSMPFRGHAEYAPEHGLWFALSDGDARLCAVSVADLELTPTVCRNLWVDDTPVPEGVRGGSRRCPASCR